MQAKTERNAILQKILNGEHPTGTEARGHELEEAHMQISMLKNCLDAADLRQKELLKRCQQLADALAESQETVQIYEQGIERVVK